MQRGVFAWHGKKPSLKRNKFVECEFHFKRSEQGFEAKLGDEGLVKEHKKLVKKFLVADKGEEKEEAKGKVHVYKHK